MNIFWIFKTFKRAKIKNWTLKNLTNILDVLHLEYFNLKWL